MKNKMIEYILSQSKDLIIGVNRVDLMNMSYNKILDFYNNIDKYRETT